MHEFLFNLFITLAIGVAVGWERQRNSKVVGIRTVTLLLLGAFMFTRISMAIPHADPARVVAQVVTGVGFIGGGIIFKEGIKDIRNLTTAVLVWTLSAVGCMTALGMRWEAVVTGVLILLTLRLGRFLHNADESDRSDLAEHTSSSEVRTHAARHATSARTRRRSKKPARRG